MIANSLRGSTNKTIFVVNWLTNFKFNLYCWIGTGFYIYLFVWNLGMMYWINFDTMINGITDPTILLHLNTKIFN